MEEREGSVETKPDIAVSNPYLPIWNVNDSYTKHIWNVLLNTSPSSVPRPSAHSQCCLCRDRELPLKPVFQQDGL